MKPDELTGLPMVLRSRVLRGEADVRAVHCDSRRMDARTAFVAVKGLREDGHRYVPDALAAGAQVLFVSDSAVYERLSAEPPPELAAVYLVANGRRALADLAARLSGDPSRELALYGVTGTNGKTTTTHLLAQLLAGLGQSCAVIGTLGMQVRESSVASERTTPEAPEIQAFLRRCVEEGVRSAAMEVSSIGVALERVRGLHFRGAAFTNLSQDHLDFHGDWASYREAKFRLFLEHRPQTAVVNVDDPAGEALAGTLRSAGWGRRLVTFGLERPAELTARVLREGADGIEGRLCWRKEAYPFRLPIPGRFNVSNLLAAVGLLLGSGEEPAALAAAAATCTGARGRFERVALDAPFAVIVDYAHSPDALEHLLRTARPLTGGRLHAVFGCGGDRDRAKRPQMGAIAERLADRVVLTNDNPRSEPPGTILAEIAEGMTGRVPTRRIADRREAIFAALHAAEPGDLVVIAGKGDETYQEIGGQKLPFDDREAVRAWAEETGR